MAPEAKPASPEYTVGQRVEILATDFPGVWETATIVAVDLMDDGSWHVEVTLDNGRPPFDRGGTKYIRAF